MCIACCPQLSEPRAEMSDFLPWLLGTPEQWGVTVLGFLLPTTMYGWAKPTKDVAQFLSSLRCNHAMDDLVCGSPVFAAFWQLRRPSVPRSPAAWQTPYLLWLSAVSVRRERKCLRILAGAAEYHELLIDCYSHIRLLSGQQFPELVLPCIPATVTFADCETAFFLLSHSISQSDSKGGDYIEQWRPLPRLFRVVEARADEQTQALGWVSSSARVGQQRSRSRRNAQAECSFLLTQQAEIKRVCTQQQKAWLRNGRQSQRIQEDYPRVPMSRKWPVSA